MRFLSLFSGIEAASVAWLPLGWECVAVAEIEKFPCAVLTHHYPDVPNLGDITKITKEQITALGHIDLVVGGFPCFAAGTSILTRSGYRSIESLQAGDIVLTHNGNWKPVVSVMCRHDAPLRIIKGTGMLKTSTTDEHPYYVRERGSKWDNQSRRDRREFEEPKWVDASELQRHHFTGQVLPAAQPDGRCVEFWWLVGRYLADGWRVDRRGRKNGRVVICANATKAPELAERIKSAGFVAFAAIERTVCKFHITRGDFYEFLEPFGRLAHGKTLPGWCLELPTESARALFDGWASGDGWRNTKQRNVSITTVSRELALGMALLAQRAFGRVANIYFDTKPQKTIIEGRTVNQRDQYTVRVQDRNRSSFVEGRYGWRLIRGNERGGCGDVFNISVADDESYIANGAIVHNCQDLSVAGKRAGLENTDGSTTRSGLFFTALQLADWSGARWTVIENVPGLFSSKQGRDFAAVVGALAGCEFGIPPEGWKNLGAAAGPNGLVEWCVLDAQFAGVPQRRRRVFLVRDTGDWTHRPPVLFERHSLQGHPAPSREKRESPTYPVAPCIGASGRGFERSGDSRGNDAVVAVHCADTAHATTTTHQAKGGDPTTDNYVTHSLRAEGFDASEDGTGRGTPLVPVVAEPLMAGSSNPAAHGKKNGTDRETLIPIAFNWQDNHAFRASAESTNPLRVNQTEAIAFSSKDHGVDAGWTSPTLQAMGHAGSHPNAGGQVAVAIQERAICENPDAGPDGVGVRTDDTAYTLEARTVPQAVGFQSSQSGIREVEAHATLDSDNGSRRHNGVVQNFQVRRLTPVECSRLQNFPDTYLSDVTYNGRCPPADGPMYKALGNSFAVPVVRWIGERIQMIDWLHDANR